MNSLAGVWKLVRLDLRRDRLKLPVVIIATVAMTGASMPALAELYSKQSAQILYASSSASSVGARVVGGPIDGANFGAITMVELFLFTAVIVAFIATSAVVRHTRQNDEFGRTELIESFSVGRYSQLAAALIVACGACIVVGILIFLFMIPTEELTISGTLLMAAAVTGVGISFAFIAAVLVQLTESSRAANGLCAFAVGIAFILRGLGDGLGSVSADGLSVISKWPVWLSPIGWGQQTHPFTGENWVYLTYFFIFSVFAGAVGLILLNKRDVGLAIFSPKPGPAEASKRLKSNFALAWRLQKTVLISWLSFFVIFGAMIGAMANEFEKLIQDLYSQSDYASAFFAQIGDAKFEDVFFSAMYVFFAMFASGYAIHALTKLRSEESSGHLEFILASKANRIRWVYAHVAWVMIGLTLLYASVGVSSGVVNAVITDQELSTISVNLWAMFSLMPATLAVSSLALLVYGIFPKLSVALSWGAFVVIFFIMQFSQLLELPQILINISPFTHLPAIPIDSFEVLPFALLSLVSVIFFAIGILRFKQRDIAIV